jgi:hypothetical protein
MKAELIKGGHGLEAGTELEVVSTMGKSHVALLKPDGGIFVVHNSEVILVEVALREAVALVEEPEPEIVERFEVEPEIEYYAREAYDRYCIGVGGKAFNGDALPMAYEFFEDPAKQKQANAWRAAISVVFLEAVQDGYLHCPEAPEAPEAPEEPRAQLMERAEQEEELNSEVDKQDEEL